jgi:hypothetical protein
MTTEKYLDIHPWDPCNTKQKKSSYLKAFSKSSLSNVLKAANKGCYVVVGVQWLIQQYPTTQTKLHSQSCATIICP